MQVARKGKTNAYTILMEKPEGREKLPIESSAHDSERALVCAEYGYPKGSPNTNS
jgi:hypothetical protein